MKLGLRLSLPLAFICQVTRLSAERGSFESGGSLALDQVAANGFTYDDIVEALQELQSENASEKSAKAEADQEDEGPTSTTYQAEDETTTYNMDEESSGGSQEETGTTAQADQDKVAPEQPEKSDTSKGPKGDRQSLKWRHFYSRFRSKQDWLPQNLARLRSCLQSCAFESPPPKSNRYSCKMNCRF